MLKNMERNSSYNLFVIVNQIILYFYKFTKTICPLQTMKVYNQSKIFIDLYQWKCSVVWCCHQLSLHKTYIISLSQSWGWTLSFQCSQNHVVLDNSCFFAYCLLLSEAQKRKGFGIAETILQERCGLSSPISHFTTNPDNFTFCLEIGNLFANEQSGLWTGLCLGI